MLRKDQLKSHRAARSNDPDEIAKFNSLAEEWWNPRGKFKVVHAFNGCRVGYLKRHLADQLLNGAERGTAASADDARPLTGLKIVDVGCGAGIVSEPLAAAGAEVFAIDAAERNVMIGQAHAEETGVDITYAHATPEDLGAEHHGAYDAALSLEVVEHVADLGHFIDGVARLVRPGGVVVIGTLNRTPKSFALGIVGAEYVLRLLPRGTHAWRKFVKPDELKNQFARSGVRPTAIAGVTMNPITWAWSITNDTSVNYLQTFVKDAQTARGPSDQQPADVQADAAT